MTDQIIQALLENEGKEGKQITIKCSTWPHRFVSNCYEMAVRKIQEKRESDLEMMKAWTVWRDNNLFFQLK